MAKAQQSKESEKVTSTSSPYSNLRRSSTNRVIAGIAGGLGEYFAIDPIIVRIIFILLTIFSGSGILIYLVLWLVMPSDQTDTDLSTNDQLRVNAHEISDRARSFAQDLSFRGSNREESRFWWGLVILTLGFLALFHNFGIFEIFSVSKLWPLILVIIGIMIINRKSR